MASIANVSPDDARVLSVSLFQAMETLAHADAHLHSMCKDIAASESQITTILLHACQVAHSSCELALARVEPFYTARNHEITDSDSISCRSVVTSALANAEIVAAALEHASKHCEITTLPVSIVCGDAAMRAAIDVGDVDTISLAVVLLLELPVSVPFPPLVQLVHHALSLRNCSSSCTMTEVKSHIVRVLLTVPEIAASANNADSDGNTALMVASSFGYTSCFSALLACPTIAAFSGVVNTNGNTALMLALQNSESPTASAFAVALLACPEVRATAGTCNVDGNTALLMASGYGHTEAVTALLACPAVVLSAGTVNRHDDTALMTASVNGRAETVAALLTCPQVVQSAGAAKPNGFTALMLASYNRFPETVAALLTCPTVIQSVNAFERDGNTALMLASRSGYTETVIALLACKTISAVANVDGITALMMASAYGHTKVVTALLACPAVVQSAGAVNRYSNTALMLASENGYTETVAALLACPNVVQSVGTVNQRGHTALMTARYDEYDAIIALLTNCLENVA